MGKNKPLVNFKDSREILLGRKMRSGTDQRLKLIGQVTMIRQELFSFYCANYSMVKIKKAPNLNHQVVVVQSSVLNKSACYESTMVEFDFTAETKSSCFNEMEELKNSPFRPYLLPRLQSRNHIRRRV